MRYNGADEDVPLAENIVDVRFDYFGDPNPPLFPMPPPGTANCLYDTVGNYIGPPALVPGDGSLAALPAAILTDGPYCGSGANEFDADLLRVRKVRVSLRVQATQPTLRGSDPALFMKPGSALGGERALADYRVAFEVAPRNLNLAR
jgi:hypothetical protein